MKKTKIFAVLMSALMAVSLSACGSKDPYKGVEPDVRNVNFGMTMEQVKEREGREPDSITAPLTTKATFKNETVSNYACDVVYTFTPDDVLFDVEYKFYTQERTSGEHYEMFWSLYDQLVQKYGESDKTRVYINDADYNTIEERVDALPNNFEYQFVILYSSWMLDDMLITLNSDSEKLITISYYNAPPEAEANSVDENL